MSIALEVSVLSEIPSSPDDQGSTELLRAWLVDDSLECSILTDAFEDPATWGIVLADLVRHIGVAAEEQGQDAGATIAAIRQVFLNELDSLEAGEAAP